MAAMTAAFGAGQLIGPLTIGAAGPHAQGLALQSGVAAALLLVSSAALLWRRAAPSTTSHSSTEHS
jgi:hypothetical protein